MEYINRGVDFLGLGRRSIHRYFNGECQRVSASSINLKKDSVRPNLPVNSGKYNPNAHNIKSLPDVPKEPGPLKVGTKEGGALSREN